MELTQEQLDAVVKGYETMPVALGAITEQLNKMNQYLDYVMVKAKKEEEEEKKAVEEEKVRKQIEKELRKQLGIKKSPDLIEEEAAKVKARPQHEAQEPIEGGAAPSGKGKEFEKAEKEEYEEEKKAEKKEEYTEEKKAGKKEECYEEEKKAEKEEEEEEEKKAEKEEYEEEKKKEYPELEKLVKSLVRNSVESEVRKLGWVKAGVTTKAIAGKEDIDIVKSKTPVSREELVKELSKLSWRQLTQLETDVKSGGIKLPEIQS